ncbi:MAG: AhpC/TSA family protein [Pseudomonadales bacterium]|nr:AhpC/TSA family protein [Pseudomonadales bacterium]
MNRKTVGEVISFSGISNIHDEPIGLPEKGKLIHLQFRRFYGCPVCSMHVHSLVKSEEQLAKHGIKEVIVFSTSEDKLLENKFNSSFDFVADPDQKLYELFGLEPSWKALLSPGAVKNAALGASKYGLSMAPSVKAEFTVPADFLIDSEGKIIALKYGKHADDQWSIEELLNLAAKQN